MVDNEEIFRIIRGAKDEKTDPAAALVAYANDQGGVDNISVIVVDPFCDEVTEC